jgi:selenocysteine-specific translation elongation factor
MQAWEERREEAEEMGISEPAELQIGEAIVLLLELLETEPLTIVIDALDECDPARRHELLEALDILIQRSSNMLKIFVSSRDDNDIVCRLSITPNVIINARDNHYDITRFVRREVDKAISNKRLLSGKVSQQLRHDIITTLTLKARAM